MRHSSAISLLCAIGGALADHPMVSSSTVAAGKGGTSMVYGVPSSSVMSYPALVQTSAPYGASVTYTASGPEVTDKAKYVASVAPPAGSGGPMTHTVTVGGPQLVYTPNQVMAQVNDVVHFVFMTMNHTVTQSSFDKPCNKLSPDAFDSNFMPNPNNTVNPAPTFEYTVTAKEPTWWYCKQRTGNHCGKGMVFAINPTAEKSFDTFKANAIKINGTATSTGTGAVATVSAVSSTVTLIGGGETSAVGAGVTTSANGGAVATKSAAAPIVTGWNQGGSGAACSCACFCGVGDYPAGDGIGSYGGMGGSLPAPW